MIILTFIVHVWNSQQRCAGVRYRADFTWLNWIVPKWLYTLVFLNPDINLFWMPFAKWNIKEPPILRKKFKSTRCKFFHTWYMCNCLPLPIIYGFPQFTKCLGYILYFIFTWYVSAISVAIPTLLLVRLCSLRYSSQNVLGCPSFYLHLICGQH